MNTHNFNAVLMNPDDDDVVRSRSYILSKKMLDNAKDVFAGKGEDEARTRSPIFEESLKKLWAEAEAEAEAEKAQFEERLLKINSRARQARQARGSF
ncbi:hypothetical protein FCV25MIE_11039 [Fagus crenata]